MSPYQIFTWDVEFLTTPYQEKVNHTYHHSLPPLCCRPHLTQMCPPCWVSEQVLEIALQDYHSRACFRAVVQPPTLTPKKAGEGGEVATIPCIHPSVQTTCRLF